MAENTGYRKNIEQIGYHDLKGTHGFQMAIQSQNGKWYLYITSRLEPGWIIMDVTDPSKPRYVQFVKGPDKPITRTLKIQVADGIMITQLQGGVEGIYIWDVKTDPENPQFLCHWSTGERGGYPHRFYYGGGRYVHLAATCKGFNGMIYRILDIIDPKNPVEVGRFWQNEQWMPGYTPSERELYLKSENGQNPGVWSGHHGPPYPKDNLVYGGWGRSGMLILDISDITMPRLVGRLKHHPPFANWLCGAWCHTVLPLSQRPYAIITSEGERFPLFTKEILQKWPAPPMALFGIIDVSNPEFPALISMFPYPEVPPGFPYPNFNDCGLGAPGPFGPHNIHEPHYHPDMEDRNDRIYCCYFHAGLRIYDIKDPFVPKEIAYFMPPNPTKWMNVGEEEPDRSRFNLRAQPRGPMLSTTEDIIVDKRGNIFIDAFHDGIYVLRCTV